MTQQEDIAPAEEPARTRQEVERLRPSGLLAAQGNLEVLIGRAQELPAVLHDIGRDICC